MMHRHERLPLARGTEGARSRNSQEKRMRRHMRPLSLAILCATGAVLSIAIISASTSSAAGGTDDRAHAALQKLYATVPAAKAIGEKARAVLIFPNIIKAGLIIGGQYGEGALIKNGQTVGHYNSVAASYGLQAGGQTFGYALFLMNDKAIEYLDKSDGWEIGVGPSVVVIDEGKAKTMTTTTLREDVYAFIFGQKGLMAGLGIQGSKITKLSK
jgi:lipid-binding SYLF domain-containing protein